jgi:hypothetical protein
MSATTSTRYDFGRCTVEHVDTRSHGGPTWGGGPQLDMESRIVVVRLAQAHGGDDALITLLDFDARDLADKILELLGAE